MIIDRNYSIEVDKYNCILRYKGDPKWKNIGGEIKEVFPSDEWYYPTIKLCLKKYCQLNLKSCVGIGQIIGRIEELESKINSLEYGSKR